QPVIRTPVAIEAVVVSEPGAAARTVSENCRGHHTPPAAVVASRPARPTRRRRGGPMPSAASCPGVRRRGCSACPRATHTAWPPPGGRTLKRVAAGSRGRDGLRAIRQGFRLPVPSGTVCRVSARTDRAPGTGLFVISHPRAFQKKAGEFGGIRGGREKSVNT